MVIFLKKIFEFYFKCFGYYKLSTNSFNAENYYNLKLKDNRFKKIELESKHLILFQKKKLSDKYLSIVAERLKDSSGFVGFAYIDKERNDLAYSCWINLSSGYFVTELNRRIDYGTQTALFEDDQVYEPYFRIGLHQSMMIERIQYCKKHNIDDIFIVIHCRNTPALNTIKKFNFKRINLVPVYYRRGSFSYTLSKIRNLIK